MRSARSNRIWLLNLLFGIMTVVNCTAQDWPLWKSYTEHFMDKQVRVIDHDAGDRTTSEGQSYGMFFALVANDRAQFDGLLHWTESNLAGGDLSAQLPAWLWGQGEDKSWGVRDSNPAADADLWMAYTLLAAGKAWNEPRYTALGTALAKRIAAQEVAQITGFGSMVLPGPKGFQHGSSYRLNASYVPLQVLAELAHELPDGPWQQVQAKLPALLEGSAPHGFVTDWVEVREGGSFAPSAIGSYDAIRVYLWAGMLDSETPQHAAVLKALGGMEHYLQANAVPPEKVKQDGSIESPKGPVGFSAALMPFLATIGEKNLENQQDSRLRSEFDTKTGLYGSPAKYYDQNLALFALGFMERRFWFNSQGALQLSWKHS
ncbi:MAG: cellulose synthase complex periplasmic endoglucanase BcsZ [Candidatus Sulfotelmatobacter sp.]